MSPKTSATPSRASRRGGSGSLGGEAQWKKVKSLNVLKRVSLKWLSGSQPTADWDLQGYEIKEASPLFKLPQVFCYRNRKLPNTLFSLVKGLRLYLYPAWLMYIWFWGQKIHQSKDWKRESFGSEECRGLYHFSTLYRLVPSLWKRLLPGRNNASGLTHEIWGRHEKLL